MGDGYSVQPQPQTSDPTGEVSRGENMLYSGTDPESYITEYTLVYEEKKLRFRFPAAPRMGDGYAVQPSTFSLLLPSLESSDTKVYEP